MRFNTSSSIAAVSFQLQPNYGMNFCLIVEAVELQKFSFGANAFLLGVDGPYSTLFLSVFKYFCISLPFTNYFIVWLCCCFLVILYISVSLLGPLNFWSLALPVGVCNLECNNNNDNDNGDNITSNVMIH